MLNYKLIQYIMNIMDAQKIKEHYRPIRRILIWVLILNWAVALAKILYGISSSCASITADGFHSLSDGGSNIIGLVGISFACRPRDADHPYGHRKYETLFSLGIALMLFIVSFGLIQKGIGRLRQPVTPEINILGFIIMLATMTVNFVVMNYERKRGRALHSDILISDALHTKADILTSISVIIALIVIKLGYPILDPIATILIAFFIAHAGIEIIKKSSSVLCDSAVILDIKKIEDVVLAIKGVMACHKIRTRGRPDDINLDLHVQVHPHMHVDNAHKISYAIEEAITRAIPEISDVIVHIEPKEKK